MGATMTWLAKNQDLALAAGMLGVLLIVFVPVPPVMMDLLLVGSLALSICMLLTVVYVREPLSFSVFPTVLLLATAFRLALNLATTRLILSGAKERGLSAAGDVVRGFGEFVAANDVIVGLAIFLVLVLVNFIVISKGATRISEVAARFTLDALPGKQMAIDADLNAGLIRDDEARRRREAVSREADFYGAMDGATKFIRGDAIAGLIITGINLVAGFLIGAVRHDMPLGQAAATYSILTIGDGLIAQLPALIVSLAAGMLVTRASAPADLGQSVMTQLFSERRALGVSAVFLVILIPTGLPAIPLLAAALALGLLVRTLSKGAKLAEQRAEQDRRVLEGAQARPPEKVDALLQVDPVELELGFGLVRYAQGDLLDRVATLRRELAAELGFVVPPVRVRDHVGLSPSEYVIRLRGLVAARGTVQPGRFLAVDPGGSRGPLEGSQVREPIFGQPAWWIPGEARADAERRGYLVQDAPGVISAHLREILRGRAAELLTRDDVASLVKTLKETRPAVVEEVVPSVVKPGELQKVLQNLLREGVSIRDLGTILETLGDVAPRTHDPELLTEYVRAALARQVVAPVLEEGGRLYVITLDPKLEDAIQAATERGEAGTVLMLPPADASRIAERIGREAERLVAAGHAPVVLCAPQVRAQVRRLAELVQPGLKVLSYNEILRDVQVESVGMVMAE